jgi:hypothetical protein
VDKQGSIYFDIPLMTGLDTSGLVVTTSVGRGNLNSIVPAKIGKEKIMLEGKIVFNSVAYFVSLNVELRISNDTMVKLYIPYLKYVDY